MFRVFSVSIETNNAPLETMADFEEDPFQMDDDFTSYEKIQLAQVLPEYLKQYHQMNEEFTTEVDPLEIESGMGELSVTVPQYEEDLDDVFDPEQHKNNHVNPGDLLTPPENFAPVINNIYRSSFPQPTSFSFLRRLKLKSILCLIPEEYPPEHREFLESQNIRLFQLGLSGNKEPFVVISHELITEALKIVLNPANQPILIHCNRGKHRTGCLVGILRKLQNWSLSIIFDEYRRFAAPKERPMDQQFIELYNEKQIIEYCHDNQVLPLSWD